MTLKKPRAVAQNKEVTEEQIERFGDLADKSADEAKNKKPVPVKTVVKKKEIKKEPRRKVSINDKNAPRNYKAMNIKFNKYEYENIVKAADDQGVKVMDLIRSSIRTYTHKGKIERK